MQSLKNFLELIDPYDMIIFESATVSVLVCDEGMSVKTNSDNDIIMQYIKPDAIEKMQIHCDWSYQKMEVIYDCKPIFEMKYLSYYITSSRLKEENDS